MSTSRPPRTLHRTGAVVVPAPLAALLAGVLATTLVGCAPQAARTASSPGSARVAAAALPEAPTPDGPGSPPVAPPTTRPDPKPRPSHAHPKPRPTHTHPKPGPTHTHPKPRPPHRPPFRGSVHRIDARLAERMQPSWREGCPVPLEELRYLRLRYVDFEGHVRDGELVVHEEVAEGLVRVFRELYRLGYPIRSMRLVDDFGADDDASMDADNTSAFNCRAVTGGTGWSQHSYGRAIDVNPVENPYVSGSFVAPDAGRAFLDRTPAPGVILADDAVVRAFAAEGWYWGGYWTTPVDYQHFSTTNR